MLILCLQRGFKAYALMVKGFSLGLVFSAMLLIVRKFERIVWNSNVVTNLDTTLTCE